MSVRLNITNGKYKPFKNSITGKRPLPEIVANATGKSPNVQTIGEMIDNIQVILQLFKESAREKSPVGGMNGMKTSMPPSFRKGLLQILNELVELEKKMESVEKVKRY